MWTEEQEQRVFFIAVVVFETALQCIYPRLGYLISPLLQ
jgi:hypothetical protein